MTLIDEAIYMFDVMSKLEDFTLERCETFTAVKCRVLADARDYYNCCPLCEANIISTGIVDCNSCPLKGCGRYSLYWWLFIAFENKQYELFRDVCKVCVDVIRKWQEERNEKEPISKSSDGDQQ